MNGDASRRASIATAAIAAALTALFLAPWWNRFLGLSLDGYFPYYGHLVLAGKVPYRDFFLHLPPLHALGDAAIEAIWGRSLFAVRLVGALERIAIAALLAAWLARRFRPATSIAAACAAVWLASGDDTEILDLYNHHALFAAIASGALAAGAFDAGRRRAALWAAAGCAAALAFWTKQTIGLGASIAVPLVLLITAARSGEDRRRLGGRLLSYAAGWSLPALAIGGWLVRHGAFGDFVEQVFSDAAASKGPVTELLARPWLHPFQIPGLARPAATGAAVALLAGAFVALRPSAVAQSTRSRLAGAALAAAVLALGWTLALAPALTPDTLRELQRVGVFVASFGVLLPAARLGVRALRRPLDGVERELLLLIVVSAGAGASLALSWPGGEAIALPGLAVVLAMVADDERLRRPRWLPVRLPPLAAGGAAAAAAVALKLLVPFDFAHWTEPPVGAADQPSALAELAGLRLSHPTRNLVDGVVSHLREGTDAGEAVFVYPTYPIFNWLADRPPATFAVVHWLDVTPDHVLTAEHRQLERAPPVAIVRQHIRPKMLSSTEGYFRAGRRSTIRDLEWVINDLLGRRYVRVFEGQTHNPRHPPIEVWLRTDRATERGLSPAADRAQ